MSVDSAMLCVRMSTFRLSSLANLRVPGAFLNFTVVRRGVQGLKFPPSSWPFLGALLLTPCVSRGN